MNNKDVTSLVESYNFSDYSSESDDEDKFEYSKETQSETEYLTLINFTSVFGQIHAALIHFMG